MATLIQVLQGVQNALIASQLFTPNTFFYAFDPLKSLNYPMGDQFCVCQPGKFLISQKVFRTGSPSQVNWLVSWKFTLWLFSRSATDPFNRETNYLFNSTTGVLTLTENVMLTLKNYGVQDNGNLFGYQLDEVDWETKEKTDVGWYITKLNYHTDFTGFN